MTCSFSGFITAKWNIVNFGEKCINSTGNISQTTNTWCYKMVKRVNSFLFQDKNEKFVIWFKFNYKVSFKKLPLAVLAKILFQPYVCMMRFFIYFSKTVYCKIECWSRSENQTVFYSTRHKSLTIHICHYLFWGNSYIFVKSVTLTHNDLINL